MRYLWKLLCLYDGGIWRIGHDGYGVCVCEVGGPWVP